MRFWRKMSSCKLVAQRNKALKVEVPGDFWHFFHDSNPSGPLINMLCNIVPLYNLFSRRYSRNK